MSKIDTFFNLISFNIHYLFGNKIIQGFIIGVIVSSIMLGFILTWSYKIKLSPSEQYIEVKVFRKINLFLFIFLCTALIITYFFHSFFSSKECVNTQDFITVLDSGINR